MIDVTTGSRPLVHAALLALLAVWDVGAQPLPAPEPLESPVTYYVAAPEAGSNYRDGDDELARWALEAWERAAGGALDIVAAPNAAEAMLRVLWVPASAGLYGEMRPITIRGGQRGAEVFIRPDTDALGPDIAALTRADPLLRDAIVYLTCLHEIGHALGLLHTANYADVMYFFGFGGDVPRFFGRYREQLESRADIARVAGLSAGDVAQLRRLYPLE